MTRTGSLLEISRVKEIQQMNRNGEKPDDLKDEAVEIEKPVVAKVLDYENVVGQDSLTRLDDKPKRKNTSRNKRNKPKPAVNAGEGNAPRQAQAEGQQPQATSERSSKTGKA